MQRKFDDRWRREVKVKDVIERLAILVVISRVATLSSLFHATDVRGSEPTIHHDKGLMELITHRWKQRLPQQGFVLTR